MFEQKFSPQAAEFLPPGRPKAKSAPLGGSKPKAQRGGFFLRVHARPRRKAPAREPRRGAATGARPLPAGCAG